MTTLVTRAQWKARARKSGTTSIVSHPSVTFHYVGGGWEFPWDHSSCDDKVRGIQADHMDSRGWSDIAYNYLVCPHDYVYEGRGYDRRSSANGNESGNNASFAICALWGTASADDALPLGLKKAFLAARDLLIRKGGATTVVKGHRDWKQTSCPGDQIYAWIRAGLPMPSKPVPEPSGDISMSEATDIKKYVGDVSEHLQTTMKQLIDDYGTYAAGAVDSALKDDFAEVKDLMVQQNGHLDNLRNAITQQTQSIQALTEAINNKL